MLSRVKWASQLVPVLAKYVDLRSGPVVDGPCAKSSRGRHLWCHTEQSRPRTFPARNREGACRRGSNSCPMELPPADCSQFCGAISIGWECRRTEPWLPYAADGRPFCKGI